MTTLYQALVRYAKDRELLARPYYAELRFPWQIELNADGSLASAELTPLPGEPDAKGRPSKVPGRVVSVPSMKRTSGIAAILGADGLDYVLGWYDPTPEDPAGEAKRRVDSTKRHAAWADLVRQWAASPAGSADPVTSALVRFLEDGVTEIVPPEKWAAKDRVLIRVASRLATDSKSAAQFWAEHVAGKKGSDLRGHCVVCGTYSSLVSTLPQSVKGTLIPGGHTSGVAPISINKSVYGYDLRRGLDHVPVCTSCAQAIPVALEHLLSSVDNTHRTPVAATTWWIEGATQFDPMSALTPSTDSDVQDFIARVATGTGTERAIDVDEFHALVLEANGPRLVVRDWTHVPVVRLQNNILRWFRDTRTMPLWPDGREYQPLARLSQVTGRHDRKSNSYAFLSDKAGRHPHAITETLRAVALRGLPLPRDVVTHLLQRISADGHVDDARAALLRLFLIRSTTKDAAMPGLDPTNQDPSYLLGRLMAVYEAMQYAASRTGGASTGPNATFADKFLAGAITSPILVLTAGGKQALAWRSKLRRNKGWTYDSDVDAITDLLSQSDPPPTRASVEQQASFLLGYHHQRSHQNHARTDAKAAKAKAAGTASLDHDTD